MTQAAVLDSERQFFDALRSGDRLALDRLLADDFVLVDVMRGNEVPREALLDLVGSGGLKFVEVELEPNPSLRFRPVLAVVVGRSRMTMRLPDDLTITVGSPYTHVYVATADGWRLLSAQGTQVDPG